MMLKAISGVDTGAKRVAILTAIVLITVLALLVSMVFGQNESMALFVVVGIAVVVFSFLNTNFALIVLILSMLLSPEFGSSSAGGAGQMSHRSVVIRVDDILLALITFSWLIKAAINKDLGLFIKTPLNKPIFIYITISLISTFIGIFNGNVRPLIGILYNIKYFEYFLIFLMVSSQIKDIKTLDKYVRFILFTAICVCVFALSQIPQGVRVSAPFEGEAGEANTLGGYLIIMMSIVIGKLTSIKNTGKVVRLLALLFLFFVPMAFTLSRSSWISIFPMIIAFIYHSSHRRHIIAAAVISIMILPLVTPASVFERITYTFSSENQLRTDVVRIGDTALDASTSERLISWGSTLTQWTEKPVLGWGVTGAGFKDAQYFRVLAETGFVGFIAFIYLLYAVNKVARERLSQIDEEKYPRYHAFVISFIASYWALVVHAIGANTFIIVRIMEPFWFIGALVVMLPDLIEKAEKDNALEMTENGFKDKVS
jgi:O-antigen ligase